MHIKRWFINLVLRHYLEGFVDPKEGYEISDGKKSAALTDVYNSSELGELINIRVANLIRRNLYATTEEGLVYKGQIIFARWLVKSAEDHHKSLEETSK
jgi:hypothetical protein